MSAAREPFASQAFSSAALLPIPWPARPARQTLLMQAEAPVSFTSIADRAKQRGASRVRPQATAAASQSARTSPVKPRQSTGRRKAALQEETVQAVEAPTSVTASGGKQASREQAIALLAQCLPELAAGTSDLKGADAASALEFLDSAKLTSALTRIEGISTPSEAASEAASAHPSQPTSTKATPSAQAQALLAQLRNPEGGDHPQPSSMAPKNHPKARGRPPAKGSAASKRRAKTAANGLTEEAASDLAERLAHADPALLDHMIDAAAQTTAQPTADPAAGLQALAGSDSAHLQAPTQQPTAHPDRANSTLASNDAVLMAGKGMDDLQRSADQSGPTQGVPTAEGAEGTTPHSPKLAHINWTGFSHRKEGKGNVQAQQDQIQDRGISSRNGTCSGSCQGACSS